MSIRQQAVFGEVVILLIGYALQLSGFRDPRLAVVILAIAALFLPFAVFGNKLFKKNVSWSGNRIWGFYPWGICGFHLVYNNCKSGIIKATTVSFTPTVSSVRTVTIKSKEKAYRIVYRNFHILGVQNISKDKTIKNLQLKFWLVDTPHNLKVHRSGEEAANLNPGDVAYFRVGYFDTADKPVFPDGWREISKTEFDVIHHNMPNIVYQLGNEKGGERITLLRQSFDKNGEPFRAVLQFSANDMPPLVLNIFVHEEKTNRVRLEVKELK